MKRVLKTIVLGGTVVVVAVLAVAATRPDRFTVRRSATIAAAPDEIFGLIQDFHRWDQWSPYEKMDPAMKRSFGGAAAGTGAVYAWESEQVGHGRMEMTATQVPSRVDIKLDFLKPFEAHDTAEFTLVPTGTTTTVTWAMHGVNPYFAKVIGLFVDMDHMIGKDFEAGLANLKAIAEA